MLQAAHNDKIGMEIIMDKVMLPPSSSSSGTPFPRFFPNRTEAVDHILPKETYDALPAAFIPQEDVCVMRPALMGDGPYKGWAGLGSGADEKAKASVNKGGYRVYQEGPGAEESKGKKLYSISRKDAGDFIAVMLAGQESETAFWWGRQPVIGY